MEASPKWVQRVVLYGEEFSNYKVGRGRDVFVHPWDQVTDENDKEGPRVSDGCFALNPEVFTLVAPQIALGTVLCALP